MLTLFLCKRAIISVKTFIAIIFLKPSVDINSAKSCWPFFFENKCSNYLHYVSERYIGLVSVKTIEHFSVKSCFFQTSVDIMFVKSCRHHYFSTNVLALFLWKQFWHYFFWKKNVDNISMKTNVGIIFLWKQILTLFFENKFWHFFYENKFRHYCLWNPPLLIIWYLIFLILL